MAGTTGRVTGGQGRCAVRGSLSPRGAALVLLALAATEPALANTLGQGLGNATGAMREIVPFLSILAYVVGGALSIAGIAKLKEHTDQPQHVPLSAALLRLGAGGGMIALPYMLSVLVNSLTSGDRGGDAGGGANVGAAAGMGLDALFVRLVADIDDPLKLALSWFCYLLGIGFGFIGIRRLAKHAQDGPRGPTGAGTIATFAICAVMLAVPAMMDAMTSTIFGTDRLPQAGSLSYSGNDAVLTALSQRANNAMTAVFVFVGLLGWIAFIRGWLMLRAHADGAAQISTLATAVHIIGGALAVNLAAFIRALQDTVGARIFAF